jgi:hypothetical protein
MLRSVTKKLGQRPRKNDNERLKRAFATAIGGASAHVERVSC